MGVDLRWPSAERRFRAMGTDCHVVVVGPGAEQRADRAVTQVHQLEARWSRFIDDSDVSRLNQHPGRVVAVSQVTIGLLQVARAAWELTDGRFDPTVGAALRSLGYDRSFELLRVPTTTAAATSTAAVSTASFGDVAIDTAAGTARIPSGVYVDFGGIGKGYGADLVTADLLADGAWGAMVNLGGDLRVRGAAPTGDAWVVAIGEPAVVPEPVATVRLLDAGLATSTTAKRRWTSPGWRTFHHLINPATMRPHEGGPGLASVIAGSAWWAEALATVRCSSSFGDNPAEVGEPCGIEVRHLGDAGATSTERFGNFERFEVHPLRQTSTDEAA